jgi:hypothetical protein
MEITILLAYPSLRLTKLFRRAGRKIVEDSYNNAKMFKPHVERFRGLSDLLAILEGIQGLTFACVIRGLPIEQTDALRQRLKANFRTPPQGLRWVMIDSDTIKPPHGVSPTSIAAVRHVIATLPEEFRDASCVAQFSSSAGVRKPSGALLKSGIRVHLFYIFDKPVTNEQLLNRFHGYPVDQRLFNDVQIHYTAAPVMGPGVACDVKKRLILIRSRRPVVSSKQCHAAPTRSHLAQRSARTGNQRGPGAGWQDPRDGLPSPSDFVACDFMRWFVTKPSIGSGRYDAARAFATNAFRSAGNSVQFVRDGLDANRKGGYENADKIMATLPATLPITCRQLYSSFPCPQMNTVTGLCRRAPGVRTPFGLAMQMHRGRVRGH